MGRIFNIAGPCVATRHYMLPALGRLPQVKRLVEDESYFVLHAPRRCGKTTAFQRFWRENADEAAVPFQYREAYPQLVLQAFLQRVLNGGGEIIREMALGKKAMDLGVLFRGAKYAVECKKVDFYEKSHEKACDQVTGYMDRLGVPEGWLVVFDPDLAKPWEGKIFWQDVPWKGKEIHVIGC